MRGSGGNLVFAICALTGCASLDPPATQAQLDATTTAYARCLWDAAKQVDDGRSDPVSIAVGIMPMCAGEWQANTDAVTQGMNLEMKAMYLRKARATQVEVATAAVLKARAAR